NIDSLYIRVMELMITSQYSKLYQYVCTLSSADANIFENLQLAVHIALCTHIIINACDTHRMSTTLIQYIDTLLGMKLYDIIPLYVQYLPSAEIVDVYARVVQQIDDANIRRHMLQLGKEYFPRHTLEITKQVMKSVPTSTSTSATLTGTAI